MSKYKPEKDKDEMRTKTPLIAFENIWGQGVLCPCEDPNRECLSLGRITGEVMVQEDTETTLFNFTLFILFQSHSILISRPDRPFTAPRAHASDCLVLLFALYVFTTPFTTQESHSYVRD
jgi:hypothetical protein